MSIYNNKTLLDKYKSCIFKITANNPSLNPYAICTSSVYHSKGLKGPGRIKLNYSIDYLNSLPTKTLLNYARVKNLVKYPITRQSLVNSIYNFFQKETSLKQIKSPQKKIKSPQKKIKSPQKKIKSPRKRIKSPRKRIKSPRK